MDKVIQECIGAGLPVSRANLYLSCTFGYVGEFGIVCNDSGIEPEGLDQLAEEMCLEIEGVNFDCRFHNGVLAISATGKALSSNISANFAKNG